MREAVPSVQYGFFDVDLAAAPGAPARVSPGTVDQQIGVSGVAIPHWVTYSRSVLSWDIRVQGVGGATLTIALGTQQEAFPFTAFKTVFDWMPFVLAGEYVLNTGSGIELPADLFMTCWIYSGHVAGATRCYGTIAVKGV